MFTIRTAPSDFSITTVCNGPRSLKARARAEAKIVSLSDWQWQGDCEAWISEHNGRFVPVVRLSSQDGWAVFHLASLGYYVVN